MSISNKQLADVFERIADMLEEQEENPYRVRAYRRAATSLRKYDKNISDAVNNNIDLTDIPRVGAKLSEVIKEIILTGNLSWLPKIHLATELPSSEKKHTPPNLKIYSVIKVLDRLFNRLAELPEVKKIEFGGSYRRKKETISEASMVMIATDVQHVFDQFYKFPSIRYIVNKGKNKTTVLLKIGIEMTLHAVPEKYFASTLLQMTGSIEHYQILKSKANEKNFRLTQKGLLNDKQKLSITSESDIYEALDLSFIPPELRENRGEIAAACQHRLPKLVELKDIKGDLHCHTNETDGSFSLEEMVDAARAQGYEYVAITDHSQSLKITHGMDEKRLLKQIEMINLLNEKFSNFRILKSMEVDILEDGSLDLSNDVLKELDITVCSVHSKFGISLEKQTERVIRAMDNPYFNILGHATGRLINHRPPYRIDLDRIFLAAKERNCFIEVNAQPARLDINDLYCKKAKEMGIKVAISSDAHTTNGFNFMILGVNQARRGWLSASDVINTYHLADLRKLLKK
jgi:DNA polymerase (family 10)